MPQLDFANPLTTSQVVWMFIIFVALFLALRNWALPMVGSVLEMREQRIEGDLATARHAKAEADRAVAEVIERSRAASAEAQGEIARAVASAKAEADARAKVDNEHLETQLRDAEQRIHAARTQAMGALRQVASETAASVVARLTGNEPDHGRIDAAVGDAIAARS